MKSHLGEERTLKIPSIDSPTLAVSFSRGDGTLVYVGADGGKVNGNRSLTRKNTGERHTMKGIRCVLGAVVHVVIGFGQ